MMRAERTHDMQLVREIISHPAIWPHVHDDGVTEPNPIDHEALYWVLITDEEKPLGVFLCHAHNTACYEMHTCILPESRGDKAAKAAQLFAGWMFNNTPCKKLITHVPEYNRIAYRFAKRGGMKDEGVNRASFLRYGVLIDQYLLGITKEEWLCQQQSQ